MPEFNRIQLRYKEYQFCVRLLYLLYFITTSYSLASILFHTLAQETSKHAHYNPLSVSVSNASDTEFRLFLALGNEIDMASSTFLISN